VLTAYLDESGHHEKKDVILAGFIGRESNWQECDKQWREALGRQRTSLHTKDLRFKKDGDRKLLERLGPVPYRCGLTAMFGHVRVSDYTDLVPQGTIFEKTFNGYVLSLFPMIQAALLRFPNDKISLVFEEVGQYEIATRMVVRSFQNVLGEDGKPRIHGVQFVNKGATNRTQPGDYLAFAMLQYLRDKSSVKSHWTSSIRQPETSSAPAFLPLDKETARAIIDSVVDAAVLRQLVKEHSQKHT
jgi:hypothetical protein